MLPLNIAQIEQEARQMRALEMQRYQGIIAARLAVYGRLLGESARGGLSLLGSSLRPLFSWNPQDAAARKPAAGPSLGTRASLALRTLFSWNPQAHRS